MLDGPERLDKLDRDYGKADVGPLEALATVDDILISPVLRRVLCNPTNFSFKPTSKILARIDRTELGEHDSLVLALLLMSHFKGQFVLPDGGFFLRDVHTKARRYRLSPANKCPLTQYVLLPFAAAKFVSYLLWQDR